MDKQTHIMLWGVIAQAAVGLISVVAIFVAPIVALRLQQMKEDKREIQKRKHDVFVALMTYRATRLAPKFVEALNSIDLAFNSTSDEDRKIRESWMTLLDHFTNDKGSKDFAEKSQELTTVLLSKISAALGFEFSEVYLKRHSYYPQLYSSMEEEQHELRKLLLQLLKGDKRLPIAVFEDHFPDLKLKPIRKTS